MNNHEFSNSSRRGFLKRATMLAAAAGSGLATPAGTVSGTEEFPATDTIEPFYGARQTGIFAAQQRHTWFAVFDLDAANRDDVIRLLRNWTAASARITQGAVAPLQTDDASTPAESMETLGLAPARLTLTFGFGAGLFSSNGNDRYGLAHLRPPIIDLPPFPGDQLMEARTGGDLSVQAAADDPQVAFHAIRYLAQLAYGTARLRWGQTGFLPESQPGETPRNLLGFKDGTGNPSVSDDAAMAKHVLVGEEGPSWLRGGSYVVVRRILIGLEHWDRMKPEFQERTIGRHRATGAPLGKSSEFDALDFSDRDSAGDPVIPLNAHVRLAAAANNGGARLLRRVYSFNDGVNYTGERWPPWRQGMQYDAGLLFLCYQRDPREGFVQIFSKLAQFDRLNQFSTHTGSGLFACPGGVAPGEFVGEKLFS